MGIFGLFRRKKTFIVIEPNKILLQVGKGIEEAEKFSKNISLLIECYSTQSSINYFSNPGKYNKNITDIGNLTNEIDAGITKIKSAVDEINKLIDIPIETNKITPSSDDSKVYNAASLPLKNIKGALFFIERSKHEINQSIKIIDNFNWIKLKIIDIIRYLKVIKELL